MLRGFTPSFKSIDLATHVCSSLSKEPLELVVLIHAGRISGCDAYRARKIVRDVPCRKQGRYSLAPNARRESSESYVSNSDLFVRHRIRRKIINFHRHIWYLVAGLFLLNKLNIGSQCHWKAGKALQARYSSSVQYY
jgi:hypothetical protein